MSNPSVFISYSHKDEEWKDRLVTHLAVLEQEDFLDVWVDRRIDAGDDWKPAIEDAINKALVAILMISANFLSSKFILSQEVPKLLERREKQGVRVIPIIVKPCIWTRVKWLSKIQARPKDGRALSAGTENQIDADLASIADEIARLIRNAESSSGISHTEVEYVEKLDNQPSDLHQDRNENLEKRIKRLIYFGDYDKAIDECENVLAYYPEEPLSNLLMVIATLKGRAANRYQTKTIKRLEKHLGSVRDDSNYYPTTLVIWALLKYDHYKANGILQEMPTLANLKKALAEINIDEVDFDLIRLIRASQSAYESIALSRFFPG